MAAHVSSNFATNSYDPGRRACAICGTRSMRSKAAPRPANLSGWGKDLALTAQGSGRPVRRLLTYATALAGLAAITLGEYPDWLQVFVVGAILLALGLAESRVVVR